MNLMIFTCKAKGKILKISGMVNVKFKTQSQTQQTHHKGPHKVKNGLKASGEVLGRSISS